MEQCSGISSWECRKKEEKAKRIFQELIFGTPLCEFRPTNSIRIVNASIRSSGLNPVDVGSMVLGEDEEQHKKIWMQKRSKEWELEVAPAFQPIQCLLRCWRYLLTWALKLKMIATLLM